MYVIPFCATIARSTSHENELRPLNLTIYEKLHEDWWEQKHQSVFQSLVIEALG